MMRIDPLAAWLLTYAVHSTLLLGLAWLLTRRLVQSHGARDIIWKTALVGGLVSSTIQTMAGITPVAGRFSIQAVTGGEPVGQAGISSPAVEPQPAPAVRQQSQSALPVPSSQQSTGPMVRHLPLSSLRAMPVAVGAWLIVGLVLALHFLLAQFLLVVRVGRRALVRDEQLLELVDLLKEEAGIARHIRLTRAEGLPSPVALGLSEICIPDAALTELDREQQESMLAHELAHLARRDPAWLVAACLVERVFFFQPLNRLGRRRIQEAAEYLCDDWAARRSGSGLTLAKCLVKVAEWIDTTPEPVPVSGMAEMRSHFVSRIHRLIANHALSAQPVRRWLAPAALAAVAILVAAAPGITATRTVAVFPPPVSTTAGDTTVLENTAAESESLSSVSRTGTGTATATRNSRSDSEARIAAIQQDTSAVMALIAALKDEDPEVRRAAASALGNRRDPRAVPALIAVLQDRDAEVRANALDALANMRDVRAVDGFITALKDENPEVRAKAAEALGNLPDTRRGYSAEAQRASQALAELMHDVSATVRRSAIEALKEVRGVRPTDAMIAALKDADADVRRTAAEALGDMEARNAAAQLATLLSDPNADVRHSAAHALGNLGDASAAEPLARALKDANMEVREAAAQALGNLELTEAPQGLLDAMRDDNPEVRHAAIEAIGNTGDARAIPVLATLVNDPDADVREATIDALSEMQDPAAMDALVKAMQSRDPNVRKRAAEALGDRN